MPLLRVRQVLYLLVTLCSSLGSQEYFGGTDADEAKSHRVTYLRRDTWSHLSRSKRSYVISKFTPEHQELVINAHNDHRRKEEAANMETVIWNDYLASMAQQWAEGCRWKHGLPSRPVTEVPFNPIGQNLYARRNNPLVTDSNVARAVEGWYAEKKDYNYDSITCANNRMCGHYVQVVWAHTREIGCGYHVCPTMMVKGATWKNALNYVCHYGPAAVFKNRRPFYKGDACTLCSSGKKWCNKGLCDRNCTTTSESCECKGSCQNCGTVTEECLCKCPPGWWGTDCSKVCRNTHKNCWKTWFPEHCEPSFSESQRVKHYCPVMCNLCQKGLASPKTCLPTQPPDTDKVTTDKSTSSPPCSAWTGVCKNGGTPYAVGNVCRCQCVGGWAGPYCTSKPEEKARVGISMKIRAKQNMWPKLWPLIQNMSAVAVNGYCNKNVMRCCEGASVRASDRMRSFAFPLDFDVADGYPRELQTDYFHVIIFAHTSENNELCAWAKQQRIIKREAPPESALSQDELLEAMKDIKDDLSRMMTECCNASLTSIEGASEGSLTDVTDIPGARDVVTDKPPASLPVWTLAVIGVGSVILLTSCAVIIWCCFFRKTVTETSKKSRDQAEEEKPDKKKQTPIPNTHYFAHAGTFKDKHKK